LGTVLSDKFIFGYNKTMIELIREQINSVLRKKGIFSAKGGSASGGNISASDKSEFGHYSSNIAFKLAPSFKKTPLEVAEDLSKKLSNPSANSESIFTKIEVAGSGFINFWLKPELFQKEIGVILKDKNKYGRNNNLKGQKTIVEYTDPNPFKEFHIGHLMSNSIGEALSRIVEWNGAKVKRACYQGDVGMHVAKAIWGIKRLNIEKIESVKDLAKAYTHGARAYESNDSSKQEINEINKKVYERSDKEINKIYDIGRKLSLEHFEEIYKKLGTKFDYYFFESETGEHGKKIVEDNLENGLFESSDGAIVFKGEKHDLHTRVFINSKGIPTYEAKELGLAQIKHKKYSYDKSIVVTANEVNDYFRVVFKAMEVVSPKLAEKTEHLSHGMLRLPTGKMSSRTGDVIRAESLLDEVEKLVATKIKDQCLSAKEEEEIKEIVSVGALKYSILKQAIGGNIIFDINKSISFEGNSGPYLQYAYVRAKSILEKAKQEEIKPLLKLMPKEISEVEQMLCRFPKIIERAGEEYAPHYLVTYLIELARIFNAYYAKVKIVNSADMYSPYKVALTSAFMQVMKNGLEILGIKVPERM
jgi:arginyl-tRNA synthetase